MMTSQQSPQFYTVSPQPSVPPPRVVPWRTIGIGVGVVALVGVLGVAGWNVWRMRPAAVAERQAEQRLAEEQSACAEGDAACLAAAQRSVAQASGNIVLCEGLAPSAYTVCVTRIALDAAQPVRCDVLSGTERDDCRDLVAPAYAVAQRQYAGCREAVTEQGIARCHMRVREVFAGTPECAAAGVPAENCERSSRMQQAVQQANPTLCESLSEEDRTSCLDAVYDADTDGDGYTNREELSGGYNPLGQ